LSSLRPPEKYQWSKRGSIALLLLCCGLSFLEPFKTDWTRGCCPTLSHPIIWEKSDVAFRWTRVVPIYTSQLNRLERSFSAADKPESLRLFSRTAKRKRYLNQGMWISAMQRPLSIYRQWDFFTFRSFFPSSLTSLKGLNWISSHHD